MIQFTRHPTLFRGIHFTRVSVNDAAVIWVETEVLLAKDAIESVLLVNMKLGF